MDDKGIITYPNLKKLIIKAPIIGYLIVALLCIWAGFTLAAKATEGLPDFYQMLGIIIFLSYITPIYINRVILYEQKNIIDAQKEDENEKSAIWLKKMSIQLPFLFIIMNTLFFCFIIYILINHNIYNIKDIVNLISRVIISMVPFYILWIWRSWNWPNNNKIFLFKYRSFFPALNTCVMSFMFGWSSSGSGEMVGLIMAVLSVLCCLIIPIIPSQIKKFKEIFFSSKTRKICGIIISIFILIFFIYLFIKCLYYSWFRERLYVCMFGCLMAFVMGVSEAWRVTTRIKEGLEFIPKEVFKDNFSAYEFHKNGTNFAASLFFPLFIVVTFLDLSTNKFFLYVIPIFLGFQYCIWFLGQNKLGYQFWDWTGMVFGFGIPILVACGGIKIKGGNTITPIEQQIIFADLAMSLSVIFGAFMVFRQDKYFDLGQKWIKKIFFRGTFSLDEFNERPFCIIFTLCISAIIFFLVCIAYYFLAKHYGLLGERLRYIRTTNFIIMILCIGLHIYFHMKGKPIEEKKTE